MLLSRQMHEDNGKLVKDYLIGECLAQGAKCKLVEGRKINGGEIAMFIIDGTNIEKTSFLTFHSMLLNNVLGVYPQYLQSFGYFGNIYFVFEKIVNPISAVDPVSLLPSFLRLYHRLNDHKAELNEIYLTVHNRLVYLPLYKKMQMSSRFYAQIHNRAVLGKLLCSLLPNISKDTILDIFIRNIDRPDALGIITREIRKEESGHEEGIVIHSFGSVEDEEEGDDEEIMGIVAQVNADTNMEEVEQIMRNIKENMQSLVFDMSKVKCTIDKTKINIQLVKPLYNEEKQAKELYFDQYLKSYLQSLRFLKSSIKHFLVNCKGNSSLIVSSFLLSKLATLRKAYLVREFQMVNDIFDLGYNISDNHMDKHIRFLKRDLRSQAEMIAEFRNMIEDCMSDKSYEIIAPFMEEDLACVGFDQLHTFTFFFMSAVLKKWETKDMVRLYMIEVMYILLNKNYEIVFSFNDFPSQWSQTYFDTKLALIEALLPNWSL